MGQLIVMVLLHKLTELLALGRNKLPDGFEDQVSWYYNQFQVMLGFLIHNEETEDGWQLAVEIGKLAHRTEDTVDKQYREYMKVDQDQQPFVIMMFSYTRKLKRDIEGVINRIEGLSCGSGNRSFEYNSTRERAVQVLNQSLLRTTRGWVEDPEADMVADYTRQCDVVVDQLVNGGPPKQLDVIPISGGYNKGVSALVKKVFNDASVVQHFESRAWALVTNEQDLRNLFLSLLHDIMVITPEEKPYDDQMEVWELKRELKKHLIDQRYLILIEFDIECSENLKEYWDNIKDAFPKNNKGSRVVIVYKEHTNEYLSMTISSDATGLYYGIYPLIFNYEEIPPSFDARQFRWYFLSAPSEEDRWKVFTKKIFGGKECPEELEHFGRRILEKFYDYFSPHLAVMIACILRVGDQTISRWSDIVARLEADEETLMKLYQRQILQMKSLMGITPHVSECNHDGESYPIHNMISICYHEMPQHLKLCFLYFSVFPKNTVISVKQLIQQWVAEGLIHYSVEMINNTNINTNKQQACCSSSSITIEDIAEKYYLEGLIGLNFVQVTNGRSDGGPKSCRLHANVWDACRTLAVLKYFVDIRIDGPGIRILQPRKLSILKYCEQYLSAAKNGVFDYIWQDKIRESLNEFVSNEYAHLQLLGKEFVLQSKDHQPSKEDFDDYLTDYLSELNTSFFAHIRSLSCFSQDIEAVSEEIWESFFKQAKLLRVLNLGEEEVGNLPQAMEELFHLRYLRVKPAKNIGVPKSIFKLWNLQTIDLRATRFCEIPEGIWRMQQLRHLYLNGDGPSRLPTPESEDYTLPNLQTLSYISIDSDDDIHISAMAPNLRKLGLYGYQCFSESEQQMTFNLPYLQKLKFAGECNFEVPITFPDTITKITIGKGIHLQQNVIKMFGELSNLQILKLIQTTFDDGELVFEEGSFPRLQLLKFEASNVVTWELKDGAMLNLHHLIISKCPQLIEPPTELWNVKTLQELDLSWASMKFAKKVRDHLRKNEGLKLVVHFPLSSKSGA